MKKSNKTLIILFFIILAAIGIYQYTNRMPQGVIDRDTIMNKASNSIDTDLGLDLSANAYDVYNDQDEYRIFLYRNSRTKRFVFPVKEKKSGDVHYCYLVAYEDTRGYTNKMAVDINNSKWARFIDKRVASIEGNNPSEKDYEYSYSYYYDNFSNLDDYDYIG